MKLENEALSESQRELAKIREECEQLRSTQNDLNVLRSDNKRHLERVSYLFPFSKVQPKLVFLDTSLREATTGLLSLRRVLLVLTFCIS